MSFRLAGIKIGRLKMKNGIVYLHAKFEISITSGLKVKSKQKIDIHPASFPRKISLTILKKLKLFLF